MAGANGEGWAVLPWAPSPMAGVERRLLIALALQAQSILRRLVKRAKRGRGPQQTPRASAVARITPGRCALFQQPAR